MKKSAKTVVFFSGKKLKKSFSPPISSFIHFKKCKNMVGELLLRTGFYYILPTLLVPTLFVFFDEKCQKCAKNW